MSSRRVGLWLGLCSALIGGGWQVATRMATSDGVSPVPPEDLVLLRYGVPALILSPLLWRLCRRGPRGPWALLLLLLMGAGLPFGLVAMTGTRHAPVAHMGVLMAGASPLFAAALGWALQRQVPDRHRRWGLALMAAGLAVWSAPILAGWSLSTWRGDALFLLAAALWAGYTVAARGAPWTAWQLAALVNAWSFAAALAWAAARGGTTLVAWPASVLLPQLLWQGLLAGVLGLWTYTEAIHRLGAAQAAAFGALAPVVSALGGWLWLDESLGPAELLAIATVSLGVLLASGGLRSRAAAAPQASPSQ